MDFDWERWAKNFPVSYRVAAAMPEINAPQTVDISRAGKTISLSQAEFVEIARGLAEEWVQNAS